MDGFFSVKIDISENVYTLKRAIKCEELHSAFRDLDLDQFALYCTSEEVAHLDDDELIQALKIPVEEGRHRKLLPQEPLSQIFNLGDSHPTKLHILVKLPYDCEFFVVMHLLLYTFVLLTAVFYFSIHAQINPLSLYQT